ncbi:MAG TPA: YesL family protein [Candidatus Scybalocola faecavium]|nr:YesL family protein [Candidatus Scybalocola faecavium]
MFRYDSRLMRALARVGDLVMINVMALLCCIPVITGGAALTAMYTCIFRMRKNREGYLYRDFFKAFKENFKQSTIIWLIVLILALLLFLDYRIFSGIQGMADILQILVLAVGIFIFLIVIYAFPMEAYFINTVKTTIKNAVLTAILHLPYTLALGVINIGSFFIVSYFPVTFGLFLLLGLSGPAWISAFLLLKIFKGIPIK